jgi:hypothetical protein
MPLRQSAIGRVDLSFDSGPAPTSGHSKNIHRLHPTKQEDPKNGSRCE